MANLDLILAPAWALVACSGLIAGGLIGWLAMPQPRVTAYVMAFGSGILIAAIAFDLLEGAAMNEKPTLTALCFLGGAAIFTGGTMLMARFGGRRARQDRGGAGLPIVLATMLDGIPESLAIGLSLVLGGAVALTAVIAVFLSNIAEALAATVALRQSGRSYRFIIGLWVSVSLLGAFAAFAAIAFVSEVSPGLVVASQAFAAGAILAMLADSMIPEAFAEAHNAAGFVTAGGFVAGYVLAVSGLG